MISTETSLHPRAKRPVYEYRIRRYPKLLEAMQATEPNVLFVGPWFSGKTRLIGEKAYFLCGRYPGYRAALVRKELRHLRKTAWKEMVEKTIPSYVMSASRYNKTEMEIRLPNGSEIHGCGLDDPQKLASTEYAFIGTEEAIEIAEEEKFVWIESRARQVGMPFHQVMYICNAGPPSHYLYQRFYLRKGGDGRGNGGDEGSGLDRLIEGQILWDLMPESYKARLGMLKGRYRQRFVENKWVGYEGLIYDVFDPVSMLVPRFKIPSDWDYVGDIDFGFHNPFVFHFWAVSPDDVWYLDREIYMTGRTINRLAPQIRDVMVNLNLMEDPEKNKNNKGEIRLRQFHCYADHDAEDRATLKEHGIPTTAANKEVGPGIQSVYDRMTEGKIRFFDDALIEKDPILEGKGKPACTVEELQGYIWADKAKEEPRKENDHGCFAAGTLVETDRGQVTIEEIRPGDFVLTRAGYQKVVNSGVTDFFGNTFVYEFSDGREIVATKDHPVFVETKGMIPISLLRDEDTLCIMEEKQKGGLHCEQKLLNSMVRNSQDIQNLNIVAIENILLHRLRVIQPFYTAKYGSFILGQFQRDAISIIKMTILLIMIRAILNQKRRFLIFPIIGKTGFPWKEFVRFVENITPPLNILPLLVSALTPANQKTGASGDGIILSNTVQNAARNFKGTNIKIISSAQSPVRLKSVGPSARQPVFNLTIENHHEYFANGILVSNCDGMRYAVHSHLRQTLPGFFFAGGERAERERKAGGHEQTFSLFGDRRKDRWLRGD